MPSNKLLLLIHHLLELTKIQHLFQLMKMTLTAHLPGRELLLEL
jgi:hypothetical protein